jgi:hypothetical protein
MASILPGCLPYGKAGELQILCCQGIKVTDYNFTLDAWALKPSGFCNVSCSGESQQINFKTLIIFLRDKFIHICSLTFR